MYRFRAGLCNEHLICNAIFCPFYIHWFLVMVFYNYRPFCQIDYLIVCQYKFQLFFLWSFYVYYGYVFFFIRINHCQLLIAQILLCNGVLPLRQAWFKHIKFIWGNSTLYNVFLTCPAKNFAEKQMLNISILSHKKVRFVVLTDKNA